MRILIGSGSGRALSALALLATLRLLAASLVLAEPAATPLEVTYYFLPG